LRFVVGAGVLLGSRSTSSCSRPSCRSRVRGVLLAGHGWRAPACRAARRCGRRLCLRLRGVARVRFADSRPRPPVADRLDERKRLECGVRLQRDRPHWRNDPGRPCGDVRGWSARGPVAPGPLRLFAHNEIDYGGLIGTALFAGLVLALAALAGRGWRRVFPPATRARRACGSRALAARRVGSLQRLESHPPALSRGVHAGCRDDAWRHVRRARAAHEAIRVWSTRSRYCYSAASSSPRPVAAISAVPALRGSPARRRAGGGA